MPCSAITLSLATILAIVATALLAISFSTDNWVYYDVRRGAIQVSTRRRRFCVRLSRTQPNETSSPRRTVTRKCFDTTERAIA